MRLPTEVLRGTKSFVIAPVFRATRSDRKFRADGSCTGCGTCGRVCPVSDIEMRDGRPVWLHRGCMQCCACINRCPEHAIQYGDATVNSGRYVFPEDMLRPDAGGASGHGRP